MSCLSCLKLTVLLSAVSQLANAVVPVVPVVYPAEDTYVAVNVSHNVTYSCSVQSDSLIVIWELQGIQRSENEAGYYIDSFNSNNSTIVISEDTRRNQSNISLECVSRAQGFGNGPPPKTRMYFIITFDAPQAPDNVGVVAFGVMPILQWSRPNVPSAVDVVYTVQVVQSEDGTVVLENTTSSLVFSLISLEQEILVTRGSCEMFEFSVKASDQAGTGPLSMPVVSTIPISPDVTNISNNLIVKRVQLQPLRVEISFPRVNPCSVNFTIATYTVIINEQVAVTESANKFRASTDIVLSINDTNLPSNVTLPLDGSFPLAVMACSNVSCRTSSSVTLNTTDVQRVKIIFYDRQIYINCSFTADSEAQGCAVILPLISGNESDVFMVFRETGFMCNTTNHTLEAYSNDAITVTDIKQDGSEGSISLPVAEIQVENSLDDFTAITNCPVPPLQSPDTRRAAIVGGSVGGTLGFLIIIIVIALIPLIVFLQKRKTKLTTSQEYEVNLESTDDDVRGGPPPPPLLPVAEEYNLPERRVEGDGGHGVTRPRVVADSPGGAPKPGIAEFIKYSDNTLTIKLKEFFKTNNIQYTKLKVKFE